MYFGKENVVKELATELAYLQIMADWWFYVFHAHDDVYKEENHNMSSRELDLVTEVREIANRFSILEEVYVEAYKIYDFRNSGKKDFVPNVELIKDLKKEFCDERIKTRLFA